MASDNNAQLLMIIDKNTIFEISHLTYVIINGTIFHGYNKTIGESFYLGNAINLGWLETN